MNKKKNKEPHFVKTNYPEKESWRTYIYIGPRDSSGKHAHLVASGSNVIYFRDIEGKEIINEFKD